MNKKQLKEKSDEWIKYLTGKRRSENTILQYQRALDVFFQYLEEMEDSDSSRDITPEDITEYKESMLKEYKENRDRPKAVKGKRPLSKLSTLNMRLRTLNAFFKYADLPELTIDLEKDETTNILNDILSEKELARVFEFCDRLGKDKLKLILETLLFTGIRISELQYITVESLKKRLAPVYNKGKHRTVAIPKKLTRKLRKYCKDNNIKSGIIFHGRDPEKPIHQTYIRNELKAVTGKARGISLKKAHPHAFRHIFAKRFASMPNGNPYILPTLLGHSNSGQSVTALYVKPTEKEMLKIVDDFEAYYTQPQPKTKPRKGKKKNGK